MKRLADEEVLRLSGWMHALEEGRLTAAEMKELEALLLRDEAARRFVVERAALGAGLCGYADEAQAADGERIRAPMGRRTGMMAVLAGLAAALLACGGVIFMLLNEEPVSVPAREGQDEGCAVLVDAADAEWRGGQWQVGMPVPAGRLELAKGLARLEFYSGASVTLEGPCVLELVSAKEARCEQGRLRVLVPSHARGFRLDTPDAKVVDLGTEFGLAVGGTGASEVHVFDGEVEVYPGADGGKVSLKTGGMWHGGAAAGKEAAPDAFVNLTALRKQSRESDARRLRAWQEGMAAVLQDPRLVLGYTFEPATDWERTLTNGASGATEGTHGSIVGARWTEGRWRGKRALQFKSPGDRVRLQVDGEFQALTLCAWVWVDGLDRRWNSLFLTDGFRLGNPHWQIEDDGRVVLGVRRDKQGGDMQDVFWSPPVFGAENLGLWFHLAVTFDLSAGVGRHFVNGRLVQEHREPGIPVGTHMRIGLAELGNWGQPLSPGPTAIRNFNGRMDEFLLYREVLGAEEVARLYEMGRAE